MVLAVPFSHAPTGYPSPLPTQSWPGGASVANEDVKKLSAGGGTILLDVTPIDGSDPDPFGGKAEPSGYAFHPFGSFDTL